LQQLVGYSGRDPGIAQRWFWLGWPAFLSVIAIFGLMFYKPDF